MCTAGYNDTVGGQRGREREKKDKSSDLAQSVVCSHYNELPSDKGDWTLDAGTSYTFLGRICTVKV